MKPHRRGPLHVRVAMQLALAGASLTAVMGCGEAVAPAVRYGIATVNGAPLPLPLVPDGVLLVDQGSLSLGPGSNAAREIHIICQSPLPPNTSCSVQSEWMRESGTFSRGNGTVSFGGNTYEADFGDREVTIVIPGTGTGTETAVWVYRR